MTAADERFEFGRNWADFVSKYYTEDRLRIAQGHLLEFLKLKDLSGQSFLDIGCGSGVHSLAAWRAGASEVFSFDYDPHSVDTTTQLWEQVGRPANWRVERGSVLDENYMRSLTPADIVYSWGVLHHTGAMWKAVELASFPLKDQGVFYIALYSKDIYVDPPWQEWLVRKQAYNRAGALGKRWMEWRHAWQATIKHDLRARRNPWRTIKDYQRERGMSYWTDIRDWLGGWPMEFAGNMEVAEFCQKQLGFELLNVRAGEGNTEFLFHRQGHNTYWSTFIQDKPLHDLRGPFEPAGGHAWKATLDLSADLGDTPSAPRRSSLMLYEDDIPVGFAHQSHSEVSLRGSGRYTHQGANLIFSATDCSDPNKNGRRYTFRLGVLYEPEKVK